MSKPQNLALGAIAAIIGLYLIFGQAGQSLFNCQSISLQKTESPDGHYRAVIGEKNCKDSSRNGVFLFLVNLETGANVERILIQDTTLTDFELNWRWKDELEVTVPSGIDWDDLRLWGTFESVKVEFRKADSEAVPVESSN